MSSAITYGVLVLITIVCLFPIVWMCLISIKDTSESITGFNSILVTHPTLGNFKRLFEMIPVGQNTFNSVFTTIMGTVTSLFSVHWQVLLLQSINSRERQFYSIL